MVYIFYDVYILFYRIINNILLVLSVIPTLDFSHQDFTILTDYPLKVVLGGGGGGDEPRPIYS